MSKRVYDPSTSPFTRGWVIPELDPERRREVEGWANRVAVVTAVKRATAADGRQPSEVIEEMLPDLAAGLMALGRTKSATVATKASNIKHAERRAKIGLWLITNYTREEFQKYGGFQAAFYAAKDEFCKPTSTEKDGPPLSEKMFRRCAREVGYSPP